MNNKLTPVSVVLVMYNEALTAEKEIRDIYQNIVLKIPGSEFIVAEEGSSDGTTEIVKKLVKEIGITHCTSDKRKGYKRALLDALKLANKEYIFFSDTGEKHDCNEFWKLYQYCEEYGVVTGVKTNRKDQIYRRLLTWTYNKILSLYFNVKFRDSDCGFRVYQKNPLQKILDEEIINDDLIASEILLRIYFSGHEVKEVNISYKQAMRISHNLPLKRIPGVIIRILSNFFILRRIFNDPSYKK